MKTRIRRDRDSGHPDPRLEDLLRGAVALGAVLTLSLPGALGYSATIGWLPLWLLGMPLASWWALHRFALPSALPRRASEPARRRRSPSQARRRLRPTACRNLRAA